MQISIPAPHFHLRHTLQCGQFFRWTRDGDAYFVHARDHLFRVQQRRDRLEVTGADDFFLHRFLSLDPKSAQIEDELRRDRRLREALDIYGGLRIMRQDPWECTAAFLTSIASNIPRITRNISDVARRYGRRATLGRFTSHAFPRPGDIDDEPGLRRLRLGFRAKYLVEAERLARSGILEDVANLSYPEAKEALLIIPGVAEKVADCVLLFAYGHLDAFPVDTWIRKVMTEMFFDGRRTPDRVLREFAAERWGPWAGYAQQFLYVWSRERRPVIYRESLAAAQAVS